jgi:hypothetical protein
MKKLLTIFGALTLSATPTAALTSVVSCAQPEVAHNYYGKSLVTKEVYQTAYDNWQKYNSTGGEYIFKNVNIGGGINIAQSDMDAFTKTRTFELSPKYQNLIIDRYDTMLEALNLIPFGAGIDYTQFTFANWKVGQGQLMFADSDTYELMMLMSLLKRQISQLICRELFIIKMWRHNLICHARHLKILSHNLMSCARGWIQSLIQPG